MGSDSQIDPPVPPIEKREQGFTCPAHHEIAGLLSFLVLFATSKIVCAIFEEEAPTPPPSTVTLFYFFRFRAPGSKALPQLVLFLCFVLWLLFWSRHLHTQIYKQAMNRTKHTWTMTDLFWIGINLMFDFGISFFMLIPIAKYFDF